MNNDPYAPPKSSVSDPDLRPSPVEPGPGPRGLGGWLILVCIGLFFSAGRLAIQLYTIYVPIFREGTWALLTSPDSANYNPLWMPLLLLEIFWNIGSLSVSGYLLVLFFRQSRRFRPVYIWLLALTPVVVVFDAWLVTRILPNEPMFDPETAKELARSLVGLCIWVPYMLLSKRVRNTFIQ